MGIGDVDAHEMVSYHIKAFVYYDSGQLSSGRKVHPGTRFNTKWFFMPLLWSDRNYKTLSVKAAADGLDQQLLEAIRGSTLLHNRCRLLVN